MNFMLTNTQLKFIQEMYEKIESKVSSECDRMGNKIPYIPQNGIYTDSEINWWTNGFWAGMMWQMHHATSQVKYKETAVSVEKRLDEALQCYEKLDHDVGFIWLHTAVADYRLTGNLESKRRGLVAASMLASRYNIEGQFIRAWNAPASCSMIIDCLMNLPLLYWASTESNDPRFSMVAKHHTETALKYLVRADGSCNHIVELDENTGDLIDILGGQGFGENSSWSRGQAWAIYGMALAYRYDKNIEYLNAAKRVAHYFISNVALTGYVSLIDFRAPLEPVYYDTTATACAACGLIELSQYVGDLEKSLYIQSAFQMLKGLCERFVDFDCTKDGILLYGSAKYHRESDREVPIIYGDYFLIELLLRFLERDFMIW